MLSGQLDKAGFPQAFAQRPRARQGWPWWWALVALLIVYLYAHYAFASLVAHVTAMFPAFFAAVVGFGAPPLLAGVAFGVFSSLNAAMTHYGTGPAPIVFGAGYLTQARGGASDSSSRWCTWRSGCRSAFCGGRRSACGDGASQ
jgi:DASS family divalent anion:Na+ symporter